MNSERVLREMRQSVLAACIFAALSLPAFGQAPVGLVGGVARDSANGKPVAEAQIIAHNLNKGTDQATVTGADGIFTFMNLEPGQYEVAATKNGFQKSSAKIEVAALRATRVELPLQIAADVRRIYREIRQRAADREGKATPRTC